MWCLEIRRGASYGKRNLTSMNLYSIVCWQRPARIIQYDYYPRQRQGDQEI